MAGIRDTINKVRQKVADYGRNEFGIGVAGGGNIQQNFQQNVQRPVVQTAKNLATGFGQSAGKLVGLQAAGGDPGYGTTQQPGSTFSPNLQGAFRQGGMGIQGRDFLDAANVASVFRPAAVNNVAERSLERFAPRIINPIVKGAITGATAGAVESQFAPQDNKDRLRNAVVGAGFGGVLGGAIPAANKALAPAMDRLDNAAGIVRQPEAAAAFDMPFRNKGPKRLPDSVLEGPQEVGTKYVRQPNGSYVQLKPGQQLEQAVEPSYGQGRYTVQMNSDLPTVPQSGLKKIGTPKETIQESNPLTVVKDRIDKLYTQAIDRFNPLTKLGKQAGNEQAVTNALTQHYGAGSTADYHVQFELAPILKSVDNNDLRAFTVAQRDLELAGRNIKGSDATAAKQTLNELSQKYGGDLSKVQSAANGLYKYQDDMVKKYLVDTGVISQDAYAAMRSKNQAYIPFKRVMDTVDEQLGVVPGNKNVGSVGSQSVIKGIKGSDRQIQDPLESVIENTYKIVGLGRRQAVAKTLVSLQDSLPAGLIKRVKGDVGNTPTISVFENGKNRKYAVPADVSEAAKGMNEEQMNTLVKILAAPTRLFRETATGVNPEFFAPNVTRDLQAAFVNAKVNPLDYVKGLASYLKKDDIYQEFLKQGGQTSRLSLDNAAIKNTLSDIQTSGLPEKSTIKAFAKVPINTAKAVATIRKPSDLYRLLQEAGQASEQPTRIAAFQRKFNEGLKQGLSRDEAGVLAANTAQEATTNFARRGSATQSVSAIYAFLNARAQGVDQLVRTAKKDPAGFAFRAGLISQAPALALYAYNRQYPSYFDPRVVSEYDKRDNFIMMLPGGSDRYIKIPKGDIGKLANPTEAFLSKLDGNGGNVSQELTQSLSAFSPINNAGDLIPTALRPVAENAANKNFFTGQNIVPDYKKNFPVAKQDNASTAPIYRGIGKVINQSPARIQNFAQGYGTGFARLGEMATTPLAPGEFKTARNQQGDPINQTPVIRRFIGGAKQSQDEYDLAQIKKSQSTQFDINDIKGGIKRGDLTPEEGINQINTLLDKQEKLKTGTSKASAAETTNVTQPGQPVKGVQKKGNYYVYNVDGDLKLTQDVTEANKAVLKDNFKKSGKATDTIDGVVYRRAKDGDVTTMLKTEYDTKINTNKLQKYKTSDDVKGWMETVTKQYDLLTEQLNDPSLDELEASDLQEKLGSLVRDAAKYKNYGGFTKPKTGGSGRKVAQPKLNLSAFKVSAPAPQPTVRTVTRRQRSRQKAIRRPNVRKP